VIKIILFSKASTCTLSRFKSRTHHLDGDRSCALTFGLGSKDWSSITPSHVATPASVSSGTAPTSSTTAADVNSERWSEGKPSIVWAFGGLHDKTDNFEDLVLVPGKWGSNSVCGSMHGHYMLYQWLLLF
jgi:hypothetical protein